MESNAMFGPVLTVHVYRNGAKAMLDSESAASAAMPNAIHTRALYDLNTQQSLSWDLADSSIPCGKSNFSGGWGDPFAASADLLNDLNKQNPKQMGTETVLGFSARILEASGPDGTIRVWIDTKTGLVLKALSIPASGAPQTIIEVLSVSYAPPPDSVFAVPAVCAQAAAGPRVLSETDRIAALTGGNAQDFVEATNGPGSENSCTVLYRVVRAGTLEPVTSGFQVALDTTLDPSHPPSYTIGRSPDGQATFAGGGLREVTAQMRNGVLGIDHPPAQFELDTEFGNGGSASALIYRQCFALQTVLLYVVKDPANVGEGGDWLWAKSGKYARSRTDPASKQ
jgi:hypothetical protein